MTVEKLSDKHDSDIIAISNSLDKSNSSINNIE